MAGAAGGSTASSAGTALSLVDSIFQRSLDDMIRSLRSDPSSEPAVLSRSLDEIRREIRSTDPDTKCTALQKLTYLSSIYHFDMSFAAFHALELLPSSSFRCKRLAFLAASLSFHPSTDVLLLITNQLRKDLSSPSDAVASLALEFLAVAATPDLARDLTTEIHTLLACTRPIIRKRAIAVIFRIFSQFPDSVRIAFRRLVDNLEDPDQRILSATIGVFCELSYSDPKSYLPLAPEFYKVLVDCKNNWVLIKVLKILTRLALLEPRLSKRMVEPICEHMRKSNAKSLVFECIRTVLLSLNEHEHAVKLAVEKMRDFLISEHDPNLRYLGLRALTMVKPMHSWAVTENKDVIVKSLSDPDHNIQREALYLVMSLMTESNVIDISDLLVKQAMKSDPEFCNETLNAILSTCSKDFYELVVDFDWYVWLLRDMSRNPHCSKGEEIERQFVDIALRVKAVRPELVHVARDLLIDPALLGNPFLYRILSAAAWISGEYVEYSRNQSELVEALLQPRTTLLPTFVRAVYIQAVFKVLVFCYNSYLDHIESSHLSSVNEMVCEEILAEDLTSQRLETSEYRGIDDGGGNETTEGNNADQSAGYLSGLPKDKDPFSLESIQHMSFLVKTAMSPLLGCDEVEMQERARNVLGLVHIIEDIQGSDLENNNFSKVSSISEFIKLMQDAFSEELRPLPLNAQKRIPVPDDLGLLENLADIATLLGDEFVELPSAPAFSLKNQQSLLSNEQSGTSADSNTLLAEHRKRHGLYYLLTEKDATEASDYPCANDPQSSAVGVANEDFSNLTQKSLDPKRIKPAKPRPVVIKLEEEDGFQSSSLKPEKELKDDNLSDAIHNILIDDEGKRTSVKKIPSEESYRRKEKDTSLSQENLGDLQLGSSRSRHHGHGKNKHSSSHDNVDKSEGKSHRKSHRSSHHHSKHKHKQQGEGNSNILLQTPVIPDFLL